MSSRMERLRRHQRQARWIPWTLMVLRLWQLLAPLVLGYGTPELTSSGGPGVWSPTT